MQGANLATLRSGRWKLHVRSPGPPLFSNLSPQEQMNYIDPRGPDGVALLAPFEQANPTQHPGLTSGDTPKAMMLFDLQTDRGEQHDVANEHPEIVKRLSAKFDTMLAEVPTFPAPRSDYLFAAPPRGTARTLMRLIGGELRYDRVPASQRHMIQTTP
jgi:hypothetical protein